MRGPSLSAALLALVPAAGLALPGALAGQSLPIYHPVNPVAEARSGLYFQPLVAPSRGWRVALGLDYGSAAELNLRASLADTAYLLDAEFLRLNLSATRDLDARHFVTGEVWAGGSYAGFLDGFLHWYHNLLGIAYPERDHRKRNQFAYRYEFVNGRLVRFPSHAFGLGDLRLGIGLRHGAVGQSVLSVTLPTNTLGSGYERGTVSLSLLNTLRLPVTRRLIYEGSANAGFTPRHGVLGPVQERVFVLGTSGFRWRMTGGLWTFANLYVHSPYYRRAYASQLDAWDVAIDFGWIVRSRSGREFRFGMVEDLKPRGPAIDADFRLGMSW